MRNLAAPIRQYAKQTNNTGDTRAGFPSAMRSRRVILRPITIDDAGAWKRFNNAITRRNPAWPIVPSMLYAKNELLHYDLMRERGTRTVYAVVERSSGTVIGDFHLKRFDHAKRRVEFGHALHPRVWGSGTTYEVLNAVRNASRRIGYTLWAKVESANIRSWKALEKFGATFCGERTTTLCGRRMKMRYYEL